MTFVVAGLALAFDPRKGRLSYKIVQYWSSLLIWASGCEVRLENAERFDANEARLIVSNHCSWFDPPAIWQSHPGQVRFVLKRELLKLPFVGWYSALAGHFLLDRSNPRKGMQTLQAAVDRANRDNLSPVVFPEGTRSIDGKLGPMKTGAFELALKGGFPIQPVAVLGSYAIWPKGCAVPRSSGVLLVRVGEPISTEGLKGGRGRKELARKTHEALVALGVPEREEPAS